MLITICNKSFGYKDYPNCSIADNYSFFWFFLTTFSNGATRKSKNISEGVKYRTSTKYVRDSIIKEQSDHKLSVKNFSFEPMYFNTIIG